MFSESVDLYDLIYAQLKNYAAEAAAIAELLERVSPNAHDLLDVGCGTGEHARQLSALGYACDGLDIEPGFVETAGRKSHGSFVVGDMSGFDMGRTYDVVLCLFSSIGYVLTLDRLASTIRCMRDHVRSGGVVVVEPWFEPGTMEDGRIHMHTAQSEDLLVCRMSRTTLDDRISRLSFEYLIGRPNGITRSTEVHELGLFGRADIERCFEMAGMTPDYDPIGLTGRGLYVASRTSA